MRGAARVEGAGSVSGNRERNVFQKHSPKHPAPNLKFSIEFYSVLVLIVAISFATLFLTIYYPGTEHSSTSPLSQPLSTSASTARKTERDRRRASSSLSKPPAPSFKPLAKDDEADDEPEDEKLPDKTLKYMDSAKKPVDLFLPDTKTSKDQQNGDCSEEWRDNFLPEKRPLIYLREAGILNHESSQRTSYEPMRKNLLPENGQAVMNEYCKQPGQCVVPEGTSSNSSLWRSCAIVGNAGQLLYTKCVPPGMYSAITIGGTVQG